MTDSFYYPGYTSPEGVLSRYFPPIRSGVAAQWLENHLPKGSWVLDPFGAAPDLAIEAARAGYKVLVTANNPITQLILKTRSAGHTRSEFLSAIAAIASSTVGSERLEPHIKSLYITHCAACNQAIQARSFLWERGATAPYGRIYECLHCGDSGEHPTTQEDKKLAARFSKSGLHRARALERVAPLNDPDRVHAEEALEVYLPRAFYGLITIINKLEGEIRDPTEQKLLSALLLTCFDQADTIWPHPPEGRRPKRLSTPSQFRENNIWLALESAINLWVSDEKTVPLSRWPEPLPLEGGICLFDGRIKDLAGNIPKMEINAVLTAFPRPNQAFWTLSALWAGWLWGHEAVEQFKSVLRRRRYDWSWHTTALHAALSNLTPSLPNEIPFLGLINELRPGFLSAVILAMRLTGFSLHQIAIREDDNQAQLSWHGIAQRAETTDESPGIEMEKIISGAGKTYLRERGEPSPYIYLHTAGLAAMAATPIFGIDLSPGEALNQIQNIFQHAFSYRKGFLRFEGSDKSLEVGRWWIQDPDKERLPLADRTEMAVVDILIQNPGMNTTEIDKTVCKLLPGLMPPETKLLQVCLDSYGEQDPSQKGGWHLRETDSPKSRRADLAEMQNHLIEIGSRLGFDVVCKDELSIIQWVETTQQDRYVFYLSASALLGKYIGPVKEKTKPIIVLPGSRSNLVAYKLKCNAHLQQIVDQGWRFIKYRHLRQLVKSTTLTIQNLDEQFSLDPLTYAESQIRLL